MTVMDYPMRSPQPDERTVSLSFTTNGAGAPTLSDAGKGVAVSIALAASVYTITLDGPYASIVPGAPVIQLAGGADKIPYIEAVSTANGTVGMSFFDVSGGAIADLLSATVHVTLHLRKQ